MERVRYWLVDGYVLIGIREVWVVLRSCLSDERIRDLICNEVGVVLREVNAVRTRVGEVHKESCRQLTLNVEVILLHVPRFLGGIRRQGRGTVGSSKI